MRDEVIYAPLLHATDRYVCSLYSLTSALMYKPSQNNIEIASAWCWRSLTPATLNNASDYRTNGLSD